MNRDSQFQSTPRQNPSKHFPGRKWFRKRFQKGHESLDEALSAYLSTCIIAGQLEICSFAAK